MDQSMLFILLALIIPIGGYMFYKSKKNKKNAPVTTGKKKKLESESWLTIKKYLKENGETGKEIVELFVERRPEEADASSLSKEQKKILQAKQKEKKLLDKKAKKQDPKAFKEAKKGEKYNRKPELWMLYFITRNAKTHELDQPRLIEAQITQVRKSKKDSERVITVNDKIDFAEEMIWIQPLKDKHDEAEIKNQKEIEKKQLKIEHKKEKKAAKKQTNSETKPATVDIRENSSDLQKVADAKTKIAPINNSETKKTGTKLTASPVKENTKKTIAKTKQKKE